MFKIKIAGINVLVYNKYQYSEQLCKEYIVDEPQTDFLVCANEGCILSEIKSADTPITPGYAESVALHRAIASMLAEYDAFLLHSALIQSNNIGIAFAARSGVGKTTHVSIWKKVFGDKVKIINGDKPIVRLEDGKFYGYGTPWNGKELYGENSFAELKVLCFIERSEKNEIEEISSEVAGMKLLQQVYLPLKSENALKTLELIDKFSSSIKFYRLKCNMEDDAAMLAYNTIIKGE